MLEVVKTENVMMLLKWSAMIHEQEEGGEGTEQGREWSKKGVQDGSKLSSKARYQDGEDEAERFRERCGRI